MVNEKKTAIPFAKCNSGLIGANVTMVLNAVHSCYIYFFNFLAKCTTNLTRPVTQRGRLAFESTVHISYPTNRYYNNAIVNAINCNIHTIF